MQCMAEHSEHWACEVYSSLKGYLFEISMFYQDRNALLKFEKLIIKLPEYSLMPATETQVCGYT